MNSLSIIRVISSVTGIPEKSVTGTIKLLDEGATIPFISRYRKEVTGGLDEVKIQSIAEQNEALKELEKRKEYIKKVIDETGNLNQELATKIDSCWNANELEDIYLPFKPKRKTRAETARSLGLEPLAKIIMAQHSDNIDTRAKSFVRADVPDTETAINGACDIIAEWISEDRRARNAARASFKASAHIASHVIKGKETEGEKYRNYFDCSDFLPRIASHRMLAMLRGQKEGILKLSVTTDDQRAIDSIKRIFVRNSASAASSLVAKTVEDSFKRLIRPSIETEFLAAAKEKSDNEAVNTFAQNVRQLLFAPPLGKKRILAIDPGFRTGCKVVCLDQQGNLLHDCVIYPTPPRNDTANAAKSLIQLADRYNIDAIALGNGTASRETVDFIKSLNLKQSTGKNAKDTSADNVDVEVFVVSEDGASVYSASKTAREEFPDKDVTVRGAVSIGRRLMDPLAELVKIDPKSIGVGQYQHDVDQAKLKHSLDLTVESCVNSVGVNINTASRHLLTYVSGLGPTLAQNIVNYRTENGAFKSRRELLKVPRLGPAAYEQCAGFLRIPGAENPLDNSAVHPESYKIVEQMAKDCGCSVAELISDKEKRDRIDLKRYVSDTVGLPTLSDIMKELEKPGRDPRGQAEAFAFDENVRTIDDLHEGMTLPGIVTNITNFGAFVDIGVHHDGLVHISQLADRFVSDPTQVVSLHQHVTVRIVEVDRKRNRISLSMKNV